MAMTATFTLDFDFSVRASADEVFGVLAHVPTSAAFFPRVEQLVDLGDNTYRWEMEKIGPGHMGLKTVYACHYVSNKTRGTVHWTPVAGVGNAEISGNWTIKSQKKGTHITLRIHGEQEIPMPRLMSAVVTPVVRAEFQSLIAGYVANLTERFGGAA